VLVSQACLTIFTRHEATVFRRLKNKFRVTSGGNIWCSFSFFSQAKMLNFFASKFAGSIWMWLTTHKQFYWFFRHFKNYFWAREHVLPGAKLIFQQNYYISKLPRGKKPHNQLRCPIGIGHPILTKSTISQSSHSILLYYTLCFLIFKSS
jgi:hypothetical protein